MMNIIAVYDGKSGHKSQLDGVLARLNKNNSNNIFSVSSGDYFFSFLQSYFANMSFFIPKYKKKEIIAVVYNIITNNNIINNTENNKILIIAIGRRTLAISLYLKKILKQQNLKPFLVYLMPPSYDLKWIDLTFVHAYKLKNAILPSNYVPINMPPHKIDLEDIKRYRLTIRDNNIIDNTKDINTVVNKYQQNVCNTAVLIGGNAKNIIFSKDSANDLLQLIKEIHKRDGDRFIIVTSRRTPEDIEEYLYEQIKLISNINISFYGYNFIFDSKNNGSVNDDNCNKLENPYLYAITIANKVIVTGESVSMLAEACALEENVEVIVFFCNSFYAKRYVKFHEMLYNNNYAISMQNYLTKGLIKRKSVNVTTEIAKVILQKFND